MIKRSFTFRDFQTVFAFVSLGLLSAVALVVANWLLASQFGTGAEILPVWNGSRAFLFEDADPYSKTIMERTQIEVYGRAVREGEYPYGLDIPFPLLIIFFPLALIPDPVWVRAVWMSLSEIGLIALVLLALQLTEWWPKTWFRVLLIILSLTWFYSTVALLEGSFSILVTLAVVGALASLRSQNDEAAGMLLAIASVKWEVALLLFLFVVIDVYLSRRWNVLVGYGMVWIVLSGVAFLIYPGWVWPFLRSVAANLRADDVHTLARYLDGWFPEFGARLALVIISVLLLVLVLESFAAFRSNDFRRLAWVAALSLAITPLVGYSTTFANLAPLIFSFIVILPFVWERWEKRPYLALLLFCVIFFGSPLVVSWQITTEWFLADGLTYLLPSALIILGLYWIRWYVVRPPRTWLDNARREIRK